MGKSIFSSSDSRDNKVTVEKNEGSDIVKIGTLGICGGDSYSVKVNDRTVSTTDTRSDAIDKAAERSKR
ncbi:TPA: hypothetical protein DEB72_01790 [Patescibacteria group bacterium]|nr:hypothetical protein [Patescibacteria group bacterium]